MNFLKNLVPQNSVPEKSEIRYETLLTILEATKSKMSESWLDLNEKKLKKPDELDACSYKDKAVFAVWNIICILHKLATMNVNLDAEKTSTIYLAGMLLSNGLPPDTPAVIRCNLEKILTPQDEMRVSDEETFRIALIFAHMLDQFHTQNTKIEEPYTQLRADVRDKLPKLPAKIVEGLVRYFSGVTDSALKTRLLSFVERQIQDTFLLTVTRQLKATQSTQSDTSLFLSGVRSIPYTTDSEKNTPPSDDCDLNLTEKSGFGFSK